MRKIKIKKSQGSKPIIPENQYSWIIGNGTSRKDKDIKQLMDYGVLYGCNWFFKKEFRPHVNISSDEPLTKSIYKLFKDFSRRNWLYTWYPKPGSGAKKCTTPEKMAAGVMASHIAIDIHKSKKLFLIGMDFFGFGSEGSEKNGKLNNLYANEKHYQKVKEGEEGIAPTYRNWQRRFQWMLKTYPDVHFYHVDPFEGKSPERLIGAPNWHQITWFNLMEHLEKDAELVDMKNTGETEGMLYLAPNDDDERACYERQIAGQENIIMQDRLHPDDLIKIRLEAAKLFRKNPLQEVQVTLNKLQCNVAPFIITDAEGNTFIPSDKQIVENWIHECKTRAPGYTPKIPTISDSAPQGMDLAPPPPPPGMEGLAPPPPPTDAAPSKMFEGLAPPPPPS